MRKIGRALLQPEVSKRSSPTRVDDSLGDTFMVKSMDLASLRQNVASNSELRYCVLTFSRAA
jgi:hypothetical protein